MKMFVEQQNLNRYIVSYCDNDTISLPWNDLERGMGESEQERDEVGHRVKGPSGQVTIPVHVQVYVYVWRQT